MSLTGFLRWCIAVVVVVVTRTQTAPNDGQLRLTGGSHPGEGRLEVYYLGRWGTICDDNFGSDEAGVACWQLGLGRQGNNFSTIGVDTSNPPILVDDLDCNGTEVRLDQCQQRHWGSNECMGAEHVALSCQVTDLCSVGNDGCSHQCINHGGSCVCACPDEGLKLNADGHTCYAPSVEVHCGRTMEVAFPRNRWPGLHEQYLALSNSSCVAMGNATHITVSVPLHGCGTYHQKLQNGFVFENQVMTRDVPIGGLVSRVRDVNMTVRCHYDTELVLHNWYIVNSGQIHFSDVSKGHYQLSMELYHNGQQYVGGSLGKVEPGEDLSIKFSLSTNDSSLQVFARNCKATPSAPGQSASQYLFLDEGCGKDPHLQDNKTMAGTQETLQLQAFQFTSDNSTTSSTLVMHCDVLVCDSSDPNNRCTQGCLTSNDGGAVLGGVDGDGDADAIVVADLVVGVSGKLVVSVV